MLCRLSQIYRKLKIDRERRVAASGCGCDAVERSKWELERRQRTIDECGTAVERLRADLYAGRTFDGEGYKLVALDRLGIARIEAHADAGIEAARFGRETGQFGRWLK